MRWIQEKGNHFWPDLLKEKENDFDVKLSSVKLMKFLMNKKKELKECDTKDLSNLYASLCSGKPDKHIAGTLSNIL